MVEISNGDSIIINDRVIKFKDLSKDLKQSIISKLNEDEEYKKPSIDEIYNIKDFEPVAKKILSKETYSYYKTGSFDEITLLENSLSFQRIYFNPRILKDVSKVNIKASIFGTLADTPFYITGFAGSNKDSFTLGEKPLASGAGKRNVIQMIPSMTSFPLQELVDCYNNDMNQWLQIYLRSSFDEASKLIREAEKTGKISAIFFTVDVAQLGRRETSNRIIGESKFNKDTQSINSDLNWEMLYELKKTTNLKFVLKGVQSLEDIVKSIEYGFDGVIISNHGGRQLDTTKSSIERLATIVPELKRRNLYHKTEILIDSGIRRGSDIVKALALGAKGVGLGRPFLYALHSYGEEGVIKLIDILKEEIELTMRLLGVSDIKDLNEDCVDTTGLFSNRAVKL